MDSERILKLLAKQMGNAASAEEKQELKALLGRHPEYSYFLEILFSLEEDKMHVARSWAAEDLVGENWPALEKRLHASAPLPVLRPAKRRRLLWRAAVWSGLLVAGGGALWWTLAKRARPARTIAQMTYSQLKVPFGAPEKKELPDGSEVWLNAGSRIRYQDGFGDTQRTVYLDGEAYFKVSHDSRVPFIVRAGNIAVRVLGTEFNVKAYEDEDKVEATLILGKVQICIAGKPDKKIVLTPHEKLTVLNEQFRISGGAEKARQEVSFQVREVVPLKTADPIPEVAWVKDRLVFQDEDFGELARQLERRFNVHIVFSDSTLMQERLSGVFENESISKALSLLEMTTPFHYRLEADSVYLAP